MFPLTARRSLATASLAIIVLTAACASGTSPTAPGTADNASGSTSASGNAGSASGTTPGGSSAGGSTGSLAIHITDSPFSDAMALLVTFTGVSVHRADTDSWQTVPFAAGSSRTCDLKKLNGPIDVLGIGSLPIGHYTQVRLMVSEARLYFDNASTGAACAPSVAAPAGASAVVEVPSGEVKLNREFMLTAAGTTMLLDFDGDKSVKQTGSANAGGGNGNANSNGSGNGNGGANGNGHGNGQSGAGTGGNSKYIMSPVIRVVSVS